MRKTLLLVFLCCFSFVASASKPKEWQDAVVVAAGTGNKGAAAIPVGTIVVAVPLTQFQYRVETADLSILLATDRNLNLTLNKKTKIAIDGQKAYLIDDEGKERKLRVVLKELKQPPK